jgi:hypothetical protein
MLRRTAAGAFAVVVFDRVEGREAYTAALGPGGRPLRLDVQTDGSVAVMRGTDKGRFPCFEARLSWLSRAEPREHPVAAPACVDEFRIVDRRIYFRGPSALQSSGFAGNVRDVIHLGAIRTAGFDVEEGRLAYAPRNCAGGYDIRVGPVPRRQGSAGSPRCPIAIARGTLRADARRRVTVRLICPRGCSANVTIKRGRQVLGRGDPDLGPTRGRGVKVRLTRVISGQVVVSAVAYERDFRHRHTSRRTTLLGG